MLATNTPRQDQLIKQQLRDQDVKLRNAFVNEDPRLEGTIPRYMVPYTLRAGGLSLSKPQVKEAVDRFVTGDGRFNWKLFSDEIEQARKKSWGDAARVRSAKHFQEIDADSSGRLSRDELQKALQACKIDAPPDQIDNLMEACDRDGDGHISYEEFVDGLASSLVAPTHVWQ